MLKSLVGLAAALVVTVVPCAFAADGSDVVLSTRAGTWVEVLGDGAVVFALRGEVLEVVSTGFDQNGRYWIVAAPAGREAAVPMGALSQTGLSGLAKANPALSLDVELEYVREWAAESKARLVTVRIDAHPVVQNAYQLITEHLNGKPIEVDVSASEDGELLLASKCECPFIGGAICIHQDCQVNPHTVCYQGSTTKRCTATPVEL